MGLLYGVSYTIRVFLSMYNMGLLWLVMHTYACCCTILLQHPGSQIWVLAVACLCNATHVRCTWAYNCSPDCAGKSTTVKYTFSTHGILLNKHYDVPNSIVRTLYIELLYTNYTLCNLHWSQSSARYVYTQFKESH